MKEYDEIRSILKFEGEYKNMKRNGKGKEYDNNGKLKYEGEIKMAKEGMEKDIIIRVKLNMKL